MLSVPLAALGGLLSSMGRLRNFLAYRHVQQPAFCAGAMHGGDSIQLCAGAGCTRDLKLVSVGLRFDWWSVHALWGVMQLELGLCGQ